jgi:hypothetical protein
MSPNRWLISGALALALLIGASIAVGLSRTGEVEFAADTPEGTVQRYIRAVRDENATAIRATLSSSAQARCELSDIRNALRYPDGRDIRAVLQDTRITGDSAEVRVRVTENTGGDLFDSGAYDHDETFDLVRSGGTWLIEQPTWPIYCPPRSLVPALPAPTVVVTPTPTSPTPAPANR